MGRLKPKKRKLALMQRTTALLLIFIMAIGIVPYQISANDFLRGYIQDELNLSYDYEIPNEPPPPVIIEDFGNFSSFQSSDYSFNQSERRMMYEQLLEGNYFSLELITRFEEMFGQHSATYIRENFTTLFDIGEDEIDEGLLNILAPMRVVRAEQSESVILNSENQSERIFGYTSTQSFGYEMLLDDMLFGNMLSDDLLLHSALYDGIPLDRIMINDDGALSVDWYDVPEELRSVLTDAPLPHFEPIIPFSAFGVEAFDEIKLDNDFNIGDYWYINENEARVEFIGFFEDSEQNYSVDTFQDISAFSSARGPNIWVVAATNTTITVETFYDPSIHPANNRLMIYDWTFNNTPHSAGNWVNLFPPGVSPPAGTARFTITNLIQGAAYNLHTAQYCFDQHRWFVNELLVRTPGRQTSSLSISNINPTGFTVNAVFPSNRDYDNQITFFDGFNWRHVNAGSNHLNSGSFVVSGLYPGRGTWVRLQYMDRLNSRLNYRIIPLNLPLPQEQFVNFTRSRTEFRLDTAFANSFNPGRLNRFMDIANSSYDVIHNLVGGNLPFNGARMRLETSRNLPSGVAGFAGQPIRMAVNPSPSWSMIYTARLMNRHNVDMTVLPIHEIAHNFQKSSWNFEPEALAVLKTHYFLSTTNTSIVIPHRDFPIRGGAGYRDYMRNWGSGTISYNEAMSRGIYSPYMFGYNLTGIANRIGWEPFRQTFRAFDGLNASQVPNTNIGKLNLFLSMLSDFSGQNVFTMFTSAERAIYENYFGGALRYVVVEQPNLNELAVVFRNNTLRPILSESELDVSFVINHMGIETASRWLSYNVIVQTTNQVFHVSGVKNVFNNPSFLRRGSDILATGVSSIAEWSMMITLERSADPTFLLPANRERLSGETIVKFTITNSITGNAYYLEAPLPNPSLFNQYQSISWNPFDSSRNALNSSVHWYLNYSTIHGAANGAVSAGDQAGIAYNLTRLRQAVGQNAFNQAFNYMANLSFANTPSTQLGRINLFLTKLRDFSGQDVIRLLSAQTIANLEQAFVGGIRYVDETFYISKELRWQMYFDEEINTRMYVTTQPLAFFGPYRNVYIGVTREPNAFTGEVFVLIGDNWERVGRLILVGTGIPPMMPFNIIDNNIIHDVNDGSSGFLTPVVIDTPDNESVVGQFSSWFGFNFRSVFPTNQIRINQTIAANVRDDDLRALSLLYRTMHPDSDYANMQGIDAGAWPEFYRIIPNSTVRGLSVVDYVMNNNISHRGSTQIPNQIEQRRWGIDFSLEYEDYRHSRLFTGEIPVSPATFASIVSPIWEADAMLLQGRAIRENVDFAISVLAIGLMVSQVAGSISNINISSQRIDLGNWRVGQSAQILPNGTIVLNNLQVTIPWVTGVNVAVSQMSVGQINALTQAASFAIDRSGGGGSGSGQGTPITPPTSNQQYRLRQAMEKEGSPPANLQEPHAHHMLPWNYRDDFARAGLNINDPRLGVWVEGAPGPNGHRAWSTAYNTEWRNFLFDSEGRSLNRTSQQILNHLNSIRGQVRWGGGF